MPAEWLARDLDAADHPLPAGPPAARDPAFWEQPLAEQPPFMRAAVLERDGNWQALRLLAADPSSAPLFEKLLRDKNELREIRQISASALNALKPDRLKECAREILLDKSDYDDIKATSLTALEQFGDDAALGKDKALLKSVDRLITGQAPAKYKQSAKRFLSKFTK